jgi:CRP/FNR family transcriptional regulator/CRP/FNR family cyclic AMP-dependent transcriptional regulator
MRISPEGFEMLGQRPLFAGLSRKELESVAQLGVTLDVGAHQVLTKEGAIGQEAFLIVSGNAHCTVGDQVEVANLGPGDLFGEMSLLDGERRSATVIADTDMTVTVFERSEFVRLIEASPAVAMKLLAAMAARLRSADLELHIRRTAEE